MSETNWLTYFDRQAAIDAVFAHSAKSKSQSTEKSYRSGLEYFLAWAGDELPSAELIGRYTDHLIQRTFKPSTIASKYLVPARHYLKQLYAQYQASKDDPSRDYRLARDYAESIHQAMVVSAPQPEQPTTAPRTDYHNWNLSKYAQFGDDPTDEIEITIKMTRAEAIQMMGELMQEISQDAYMMGWCDDLETDIPPLVDAALASGLPQKFNWGTVEVMQAKTLKALETALGHWVTWDVGGFRPYTPDIG